MPQESIRKTACRRRKPQNHASLHRRALITALALLMLPQITHAQQPKVQCPPETRVDNVVDNYFGTKIADPYRWLEDQNSPETRAWITAENRCTDAAIGSLPGRDKIAARLSELMKVESVNAPIERGGRYFFAKRAADGDLYIIYMRQGMDGPDQMLVDPRPLSKDHSTSVDLEGISTDGRMMAYGVRLGGQDQVTVHFLDVDKREQLPDVLPSADYFSVAIKPDLSGAYYARMTENGPRVLYHAMRTPDSSDTEIFGKGYASDKIIFSDISEDGRNLLFVVAYGAGTERSEVYAQNLQNHGPIVPIVNDIEAFFDPRIAGNTVYLFTNWNAPNWRVLAVDLENPARAKWKEVIPEGKDRMDDIRLAGGKVIASYLHDATNSLRIFDSDGKADGEIPLPALGSAYVASSRWASDEVFVVFASYAYPSATLRFNLADRKLTTWAKPNVPVHSEDFEVRQVWYPSKDGTKIPMFLFYKKGLKLTGDNPVLLTGYGGFDVAETPSFSQEAVVWAERGGVYADANMRGGGEFGEAWHHAGMMEKKQNVFDDFYGAAEWLVREKYTNPQKLSIIGVSNGGLLMGASLTQRPDLFRAVVCEYPLLDMLRYQKFMVARFWVPEYGSAENAEQFKHLRAYSPYQNVLKGTKYPAVLFITGDGDTRVAPLHARKMTALLQASTGSDRPILLMYDTKSGHSGGRPLGQQIAESTNIISFLFWQLGVSGDAYP
ncbi:MAG TPA: prolyl oligopeptidase family serine peptidase [Candidatus Acidoferrales bacterium]|nr:prolyl oligopeptidase family serine peptidase [Candidatus Acidoferrales bacterium]